MRWCCQHLELPDPDLPALPEHAVVHPAHHARQLDDRRATFDWRGLAPSIEGARRALTGRLALWSARSPCVLCCQGEARDSRPPTAHVAANARVNPELAAKVRHQPDVLAGIGAFLGCPPAAP